MEISIEDFFNSLKIFESLIDSMSTRGGFPCPSRSAPSA